VPLKAWPQSAESRSHQVCTGSEISCGSLLAFAEVVRHDLQDLRPRDMIDIQSFLWVQGSEEYR
jgi:hypothetical protein